jgi:manganese/zinc/iron transport system substrate-binding protein
MVADVVRNVGGDHVDVEQIMGAGVDPHLYKSTRDDVAIILSGDIVFYSGLLLEGKMSSVLEKLSKRQRVVAVTDDIDRMRLLSSQDSGDHFDPHVWMDVNLWSQTATRIADSLSELAPEHAEIFHDNLQTYQKRLSALDAYAKTAVETIPKESRLLVTSHDAFNYLGRAYGIEVVGIQGLSTESEAGLQHINNLVDTLVERNVHAVFIESSVSQKNVIALVDGARARGHSVKIGGELFSDAMGTQGTYEGTYIGMIDHNITTIVHALGGTAPPRGLNGQLSEERSNEQLH